MQKILIRIGIYLLPALFAVCSCKENDYTAYSPEFSDITFITTEGKADDFRAGDKIVATAVQSRIGKYLYKATYTWTSNPSDGVSQQYPQGAIYDNEPFNPTDTLMFSTPGTYNLTFKARYNISSAEYEQHNFTVRIPDGKITYTTPSFMYFDVTIEKQIKIKP